MKSVSFLFAFAAPALLVATLAGCGSRSAHAPGQGGAYGPSAGRVGMGRMMGDQQAMCELYRRITGAHTRQERLALMDRYMGGMSPATRKQRMRMMRERCE